MSIGTQHAETLPAAIRLLSGKDAQKALPALADILIDCVADGASVGFLSPYGRSEAMDYWSGVAAAVANGTVLLFIAEAGGRMLGTVQLGIGLPPNQPHRADLKKLLVHRDGRRQGLARQLMAAAETEALKRGRHVLVLDTAAGSPAEAIYAGLGWTRVGTIPDYALYPDGSLCGSTFFYKALREGSTPSSS